MLHLTHKKLLAGMIVIVSHLVFACGRQSGEGASSDSEVKMNPDDDYAASLYGACCPPASGDDDQGGGSPQGLQSQTSVLPPVGQCQGFGKEVKASSSQIKAAQQRCNTAKNTPPQAPSTGRGYKEAQPLSTIPEAT